MDPLGFIQQYCREGGSLQGCLQGAYNMGIVIAIAAAFLYVVTGALEYMLGAAINTKESGKKKITGAIIGLIVIFVSGVVLYWINPNIFSAELIIFRVTKLELPVFELDEMRGTIVNLSGSDPEFVRFTGSERALVGAQLDENALSSLPRQVQEAVRIAFQYANSTDGQQRYRGRYGHLHITSCSHFVWRVLQESNNIPTGVCFSTANGFGNIMRRSGWQKFNFNKNKLQPGDVLHLIREPHGHVAIVVPVIAKNGKSGLILAEANFGRNPPHLTQIYEFQTIWRAASSISMQDSDFHNEIYIRQMLDSLKCTVESAEFVNLFKLAQFKIAATQASQTCPRPPEPKYENLAQAARQLYQYTKPDGKFGTTYREIQETILQSRRDSCNLFILTASYLTKGSGITLNDINPVLYCQTASKLDEFFKNRGWIVKSISEFRNNIRGILPGDILQNIRAGIGHVIITDQIEVKSVSERYVHSLESAFDSHQPQRIKRNFDTAIIGGSDPYEKVIRLP